jgi:hypothetical protein
VCELPLADIETRRWGLAIAESVGASIPEQAIRA